jgi:hypothetical protein
MRISKFIESLIIGILGKGESGLPVAEIFPKNRIINAIYISNQLAKRFLNRRMIGLEKIKF